MSLRAGCLVAASALSSLVCRGKAPSFLAWRHTPRRFDARAPSLGGEAALLRGARRLRRPARSRRYRRPLDQLDETSQGRFAIALQAAVGLRLEMMTPSWVSLFPASFMRRSATSVGSEGERLASKRNKTAVEEVLTCWPPGPEARTEALRDLALVDGEGGCDRDHDRAPGEERVSMARAASPGR